LERHGAEEVIDRGSELLCWTVFSAEEEIVELARDVYRGDRTEFYVTAPVEGIAVSVPRRADR